MKGTSNLVHIIILLVITFFVAAGSIMVVRSAAENADEPTTGTLSALRNPSLGERLYCKIYCPDPVNDCDVPEAKKEMCKAIADSPADFTYTGTVPEPSGVSAIVDGSFIPGGTLIITFSVEAEADYGSIDQGSGVKIYEGSTGTSIPCTEGEGDTDKCGVIFNNGARTVEIRIPYERDANHIEQKIREGTSYKISLQNSDGDDVFSFSRTWSCPQPQILDGRYYPEKEIVFTFPIEGAYSWVELEGYDGRPEKIEIGKRLGGAYDPCDDAHIYSTCTATVSPAGESYEFTMPYIEPGEKVAISYPVYAAGIDAPSPMCRSGKQDYVYNCPTTACYEEGPETYIVSSLKDTGAFEANIACKYDIKQEQCALGCIMLLGNTAECSLPKPDLIAAYIAVKKDGAWAIEKELNAGTGKYELKDDLFPLITGYDKKRVFVAIKNTAKAIEGNPDEPKIRANNLEVTALLDSVPVAVSPVPMKYYDTDGNSLAINVDSPLNPGYIFEYEIILDGLCEGLGDIGPHTVNIDLSVVGTFDSGAPAKISADTNTARSYPHTLYPAACKDCSCTTQDDCEFCGSRCIWDPLSAEEADCLLVK